MYNHLVIFTILQGRDNILKVCGNLADITCIFLEI